MKDIVVYKVTDYKPNLIAQSIHKKMFEIVQKIKPKSVLEIGSGIGELGNLIQILGVKYTGIEPDEEQFKISKQNHPELNVIKISCYDAPKDLKLGRFDLVISNDVIEHLYLPRKLVTFIKEHVNKNGKVITCTPDYGSYFKNLFYSITNRWDQIHSVLWDGGHIKFFSKKTLKIIFEEQGFTAFQWKYVRNLRFPILTISVICICSLEN